MTALPACLKVGPSCGALDTAELLWDHADAGLHITPSAPLPSLHTRFSLKVPLNQSHAPESQSQPLPLLDLQTEESCGESAEFHERGWKGRGHRGTSSTGNS